MPKKSQQAASATDWETVSTTGFPPMWKPVKRGEDVIITPTPQFRTMKIRKGGKGKVQENFAIECLFQGGSSDSFFSGKGSKAKASIGKGDTISIPLSFGMLGQDKVAVIDANKPQLSALSKLVIKDKKQLRLIFDGKEPIGGGQTVKRLTIQAPAGYKEKVIEEVGEIPF